jgi:FtsP/CotA-like multicopper oxidase with cupredoxin domain
MRLARIAAALLLLAPWGTAHALPRSTGEIITPNDNRRPAGRLADGVLTIELEARRGAWYPEGPAGKSLEVAAWGEPGKPLMNPGPLVRVPLGTRVRATLRNTLAEPLRVYGLGPRDSVVLAPGESREVAFTASAAGTFYYAGVTGRKPLDARLTGDSQLNGAVVVDAPNGTAGLRVGNDRVFLLSWYFTLDSTSRTGLGHGTMTINGLAWPHTERVDLLQGDSVRWRVVNLTSADHPMHLHGFYFRVDAKGDGARDTLYAAADRRLAVTEVIEPRQTMTLAWAPQRSGNWIFHCHYHSHISSLSSLDTERGVHDAHAAMSHGGIAHDTSAGPPHQMFGLVLGVRVAPNPDLAVSRPAERRERPVRILVRQRPNVYGDRPGYAFVFGGTADDAGGALPIPARPLVLTRGEPVAITIVNTASAPATIHWHGIELDSYPDGVPGWSGDGQHVAPSIRPGDSLTVRFTPPRAGTFMYHSHFDEFQQINSGLYGPIVVLEPGQRYDPETDRIFFVSGAGPTDNVIRGPFAPLLLNGAEQPAPMTLRAGVTYRFRFLNLSDDFPTMIALKDGDRPATWRALAKDGAALPQKQATERPAMLVFDPGETYDFTFTPQGSGELSLSFGHLQFPGGPKFTPVTVPVHVPF